ncbi:MAG TPA: PilW family protein, partial [Burkholderiales bacterium]|nr:PilW family protein [Burkholderiales bacterium]
QSIPIQIVDGGTGSDSLVTARLDSDTGGVATGGGRAQLAAAVSSIPGSITVDTGEGIKANDYIMISETGLACSLLQVTSVAGTTVNVQSVANSGGTSGSPSFPSYAGNASVPYAVIVDIGQSAPFTTSTYSVASGNLVQSDNGGTAQPAVANIVNIQAQYGVAPAGSQSISCWTDAKGSKCSPASGDWANPTSADFERIKAIRLAVVARSSIREKPTSGTTCNATTAEPTAWPSAGLPTGSSNPPTINLSSDSNWQCYRYKVYSTIVPLRNVIWGNL